MELEWIDGRDAVRLIKGTVLIIRWYHRSTGFRTVAGHVVKAKPEKNLKLRLWLPETRTKAYEVKVDLVGNALRHGKIEYQVRYPLSEKEQQRAMAYVNEYLIRTLGWRYDAKKRHEQLSSWQYWAGRRAEELSRCGQS